MVAHGFGGEFAARQAAPERAVRRANKGYVLVSGEAGFIYGPIAFANPERSSQGGGYGGGGFGATIVGATVSLGATASAVGAALGPPLERRKRLHITAGGGLARRTRQ